MPLAAARPRIPRPTERQKTREEIVAATRRKRLLRDAVDDVARVARVDRRRQRRIDDKRAPDQGRPAGDSPRGNEKQETGGR
jgi:hypothetical protein